MREGIILAAGIGSRLNVINNLHMAKPLASVNSLALLLRTVRSLELAECHKVVIVLGYQADSIKKYVRSSYSGPVSIEFVVNKNFRLQNGLSVLCARRYVGEEFVLTMADHVLDDEIMYLVRHHNPPKGGSVLCVDFKLDTIFDIDDATKVRAESGRIKKIGKSLEKYNCIDTGVFIGTEGLFEAIDCVYKQKGDASLSEGVQILANKGLMEVLDIKDAYWQDVDNMEMLSHAEKLLSSQVKSLRKFATL